MVGSGTAITITNLLRNAVEAIGAAGGGAREIEVRAAPSAEAAVLTVGRSRLGGAEFQIVLPCGVDVGGVREADGHG